MRRAVVTVAFVLGVAWVAQGACLAETLDRHHFHVGPIYNHFGHCRHGVYSSFGRWIGHSGGAVYPAPIPPCPQSYGGSYGGSNRSSYINPNRAPRDFWMLR